MKIIEVADLVKEYGEIRAVDGVSFNVNKGEIFGFIGPNGAGKTTTINILCTMLRPTSGQVKVGGIDVQLDPAAVRRSIGIVFQEPSLDNRMTGFENLEFHGLIYGLAKDVRRPRIAEVLELVELTHRKNDLVKTYSGGMKRRLEIARGLLHYPQVLFLDEPTWGLDPQTRAKMWEYIYRLKEENDLTVFLTTHYLQEAEVCSNIYIMDRGKIIASGTPEELKRSIGGDVVDVDTEDNERAITEITERTGKTAVLVDGKIQIEVENGATFIPSLLTGTTSPIKSVSFRQPTLDDVFLKLTGRQIREEEHDVMDTVRDNKKFKRAGANLGKKAGKK